MTFADRAPVVLFNGAGAFQPDDQICDLAAFPRNQLQAKSQLVLLLLSEYGQFLSY
jgi:hypothetical protein